MRGDEILNSAHHPISEYLFRMTLFHFANCLAVTVAPYFILYRFSAL
jgi:hypothetical protein